MGLLWELRTAQASGYSPRWRAKSWYPGPPCGLPTVWHERLFMTQPFAPSPVMHLQISGGW